jgi:hypothetical protein
VGSDLDSEPGAQPDNANAHPSAQIQKSLVVSADGLLAFLACRTPVADRDDARAAPIGARPIAVIRRLIRRRGIPDLSRIVVWPARGASTGDGNAAATRLRRSKPD